MIAACSSRSTPSAPVHEPVAPRGDAPRADAADVRTVDAAALVDAPLPDVMADAAVPPRDAAIADAGVPRRRVKHARAPGCPRSVKAATGGCTDWRRCEYDEATCFCVGQCFGGAARPPMPPGGAKEPSATWKCFPPPPPRTDGCPDEPPRDRARCTPPKQCSYGEDTTGLCFGATYACSQLGWMPIQQPAPP